MLNGFFIRVLNEEKDGFAASKRLYEILQRVCDDFDVSVKDSSDYHALGKISDQVTEAIRNADVIFADANSSNENIWYEIGYSDKTDARKVICLYKRGRVLPFDRTDMRSLQYDDDEPGLLFLQEQLKRTLFDLLCDKRLRQLFVRGDAKAAAEYLASKNLRKLSIDWLTETARNAHESVPVRTAAIRTLGLTKLLTPEILGDLTEPLENIVVRAVAYEQAASLAEVLTLDFWDRAADVAGDDAALSAYAIAAVRHWLGGHLNDGWFRERLLQSTDQRIRAAVLTAVHRAVSPAS
jgi:hypothetical protein